MNEAKRLDAGESRLNPDRVTSVPLADKILETVPSLVCDLQSLLIVAQTNPDEEEEKKDDPEVRARAAARLGEAMSQIRTLVEDHKVTAKDLAARVEAETPDRQPERRSSPDRRKDRWAHLRDAFENADEGDDQGVEASVSEQPARPSPIDRIRAKTDRRASEARVAATAPQSDAPATEPQEAVTPEAPAPRNWDKPEDHSMSRKGKYIWTAAIYGAIIAVPTLVFATSPFTPKATAQHYAAAFGCGFAKALGVDRATQGEPGYHASLDDNNNGVACEPTAATRSLSGGGGAFKSVR